MLKSTLIRATEAGAKVMQQFFHGKFEISNKEGVNNLVTEADHASEKAIFEIIKNEFTDHFILSEEPAQDPTAFFTRKKRYALHCQGIVDFRGIFINYVVGWPGSVHDARVYANSDFFLNKAKYIEGEDYILDDSTYLISSFLITPFKNPFNYHQR